MATRLIALLALVPLSAVSTAAATPAHGTGPGAAGSGTILYLKAGKHLGIGLGDRCEVSQGDSGLFEGGCVW